MFIIANENTPDRSRLPLTALLLILVNLLIFLLWQSRDERLVEQALASYQSAGLLTYERQSYLTYQNRDSHLAAPVDQLDQVEQDALLRSEIMWDRGFDRYLQEQQPWQLLPPQNAAYWQQARHHFQQQRDQLSHIRAGLTPAQPHPWQLFSSQFLHGNWIHLFGNLVFLWLLGLTLEGALKPPSLVLLYLTGGALAGLVHSELTANPWLPLVGASGGVAALMGASLALYSWRSISASPTRARPGPGILMIFLLWIGKEVASRGLFIEPLAWQASVTGLLAGAGLLAILAGLQALRPARPAPLSRTNCLALAGRCYRQDNRTEGWYYLQRALAFDDKCPMLINLLRNAIIAHHRQGELRQARRLAERLKQLQTPASSRLSSGEASRS